MAIPRKLQALLSPQARSQLEDWSGLAAPPNLAEAATPTEACWHLVLIPDSGPPCLESYTSWDEFRQVLRRLVQSNVPGSFYAFFGQRLLTTDPPRPYLLHGQRMLPLFDTEALPQVNQDGFLGDRGRLLASVFDPDEEEAEEEPSEPGYDSDPVWDDTPVDGAQPELPDEADWLGMPEPGIPGEDAGD